MTIPPIPSLAQAIANAEGYGVPNAIPTNANNPGNLKIGDVGNGTVGGITIFSTAEDGWTALQGQLTKMFNGTSNVYNPSMTIEQVGQLWSNGDPNWSNNVSNSLSTSSQTPLSSLGNGASPVTPSSGLGTALQSLGPLGDALNHGLGLTPVGGSASIARLLVVIVGIILIAAGLFAFKTTQTVIQTGTRAVKTGAELSGG